MGHMTLLGCGKPPASGETFALTYESQALNNTDLTTYTFAGQDIGTASAGRRVLFGIVGRRGGSTASTLSATLAGNAATEVVSTSSTTSGVTHITLFSRDESSGATADIVGTFDSGMLRSALEVATVRGFSGAPDTDANYVAIGTTLAITLTVPTGGAGFVMAFCSTTVSLALSGTGVTENALQTLETGMARSATLSTAGSITVTATAGAAGVMAIVGAAYGP